MIPIEQASSIISKNLLNDVNKSKCITHVCMHRKGFSTKLSRITLYESVKNKFLNIYEWYQEFSGFKEMQVAHEKVVAAREKLEILQQERRQAWSNLAKIQKEVRENYTQLEHTKKVDERYLELVKTEHKLLMEEEALKEMYKSVEMAERAQFNNFTNVVKSSHELEKIQTEKRKYFSLIASFIGVLAGIIASSVNHYFKMSEIKLVLSKVPSEFVSEQLQTQSEKIENLTEAVSQLEKNYDKENFNYLCDKLNERLVSMENFVRTIENRDYFRVLGNDEPKQVISDSDYSGISSKYEIKKLMNVLPTGIICIVGLIILGKMFQ